MSWLGYQCTISTSPTGLLKSWRIQCTVFRWWTLNQSVAWQLNPCSFCQVCSIAAWVCSNVPGGILFIWPCKSQGVQLTLFSSMWIKCFWSCWCHANFPFKVCVITVLFFNLRLQLKIVRDLGEGEGMRPRAGHACCCNYHYVFLCISYTNGCLRLNLWLTLHMPTHFQVYAIDMHKRCCTCRISL